MGVPGPEPEPAALVAEVVRVVVTLELLLLTDVVLVRLEVVEAGCEVDAAVLLVAGEDVAALG